VSSTETSEQPPEAEPPAVDSEPAPTRGGRRLRRPTLLEASALVALIGAIVALVFKFAPDLEPQPSPTKVEATISEVRAVRPVTFRRFLQRQQLPISPEMTPEFLARRGVMIQFAYTLVGLSGKNLRLSWQLSDAVTNELVAEEQSAYLLTPSRNEDSGDWAVWIAAPKQGRTYYATVTIFKPQGPPYELKHFDTPRFPGFATRPVA
jgi:hypothetical protein